VVHAVMAASGAVLVAGEDLFVAAASVSVDRATRMADVVGLAHMNLRFPIQIEGGDYVTALQGFLPLGFEAEMADAVR
jgi:hypothetical protein